MHKTKEIYVFIKIIVTSKMACSYLQQVWIDVTDICCIYSGPIDTIQAICLSYVVVPW